MSELDRINADQELVFAHEDGEPFTTSVVIAEQTGNQHKNAMALIREHLADLNEVGRVAFETRPFQTAGGMQRREIAELDEPAAALLTTYLKNTAPVRDFKKRLVRDFYQMRQMLAGIASAPALPDRRALARMVIEAEDRADAEALRADKAEQRAEIEQRHRRAIEGGDGIDPTTFGKKYFSDVRKTDFDAHLYAHGYLINQRNTRVRADGEIRDGYDHRKPTAKGRKFFYPHDNGVRGGRRRFTARVRPQMEIALRDALAAEGLPVNTHSTGLILLTEQDMKELES